jgi:crotonobetainyl-CoA:carnitine CoA-transferase CaiB-like acyl-CoA transferase
VRNRAVLDATIQSIIELKTVEDWCRRLDEARIAYGRVSGMDDLIAHPSAATVSVETPGGPVELLAPPVVIDGRRRRLGPVPKLGQHDEALRREFGGGAASSPAQPARSA